MNASKDTIVFILSRLNAFSMTKPKIQNTASRCCNKCPVLLYQSIPYRWGVRRFQCRYQIDYTGFDGNTRGAGTKETNANR